MFSPKASVETLNLPSHTFSGPSATSGICQLSHLWTDCLVILCAACGVTTLRSLPIIPLNRETEPSSTPHPAGPASRSEQLLCFQSLVPKSWSAFQRTPNIRGVWRPQPPPGRCQQTMFVSTLRIVQREGFRSCQVMTFLPSKCRKDSPKTCQNFLLMSTNSTGRDCEADGFCSLGFEVMLLGTFLAFFSLLLSLISGLLSFNNTWAQLDLNLFPLQWTNAPSATLKHRCIYKAVYVY